MGQQSREQVGGFFVKNNGNRLRLILDCRFSNCHFRSPDNVRLCSGEALSLLSVDESESLYAGGADLRDAFYHLALPERLRDLFTMRSISASALGLTALNGVALRASARVVPRVRVNPMGWTWALRWMQRIHERAIMRGGVPESENLVDGAPALDVRDGVSTAYVDNFIAFDVNYERAQAKVPSVMSELTRMGIEVERDDPHEKGGDAEVLGWEIRRRPASVRPRPERLRRARFPAGDRGAAISRRSWGTCPSCASFAARASAYSSTAMCS